MRASSRALALALALTIAAAGATACSRRSNETLSQARAKFVTKIDDDQPRGTAAPRPPPGVLDLVRYPSPVGPLAAYVSPRPADGARRPAIVWIVGGFDNGIDDTMFTPQPATNDQSARAFRDAGVVLFVPSFRGGNDNPGTREILLGEVDDVLAAADYVAALPYVDPRRIYLGGHSTGGTLALLVAETSSRFRAVFAFGAVADARVYGADVPALARRDEARVRSPEPFLWTVKTPTFLVEGTESANAPFLRTLAGAAGHAPVRAIAVPGADHFSVLASATPRIARAILADSGPTSSIALAAADLAPR